MWCLYHPQTYDLTQIRLSCGGLWDDKTFKVSYYILMYCTGSKVDTLQLIFFGCHRDTWWYLENSCIPKGLIVTGSTYVSWCEHLPFSPKVDFFKSSLSQITSQEFGTRHWQLRNAWRRFRLQSRSIEALGNREGAEKIHNQIERNNLPDWFIWHFHLSHIEASRAWVWGSTTESAWP